MILSVRKLPLIWPCACACVRFSGSLPRKPSVRLAFHFKIRIFLSKFRRPVLGGIDTDLSDEIYGKRLTRSVRFEFLCTCSDSKFYKITVEVLVLCFSIVL